MKDYISFPFLFDRHYLSRNCVYLFSVKKLAMNEQQVTTPLLLSEMALHKKGSPNWATLPDHRSMILRLVSPYSHRPQLDWLKLFSENQFFWVSSSCKFPGVASARWSTSCAVGICAEAEIYLCKNIVIQNIQTHNNTIIRQYTQKHKYTNTQGSTWRAVCIVQKPGGGKGLISCSKQVSVSQRTASGVDSVYQTHWIFGVTQTFEPTFSQLWIVKGFHIRI